MSTDTRNPGDGSVAKNVGTGAAGYGKCFWVPLPAHNEGWPRGTGGMCTSMPRRHHGNGLNAYRVHGAPQSKCGSSLNSEKILVLSDTASGV